jgi:hypothetical protein
MAEAAGAALVNRDGPGSSEAFDAAVGQRSAPELRELAHAVRDLVYDVYPETVEVVWPRQGSIGWGVGPKKMSEHFCYLLPFRQHVTLGFYYGAELADPAGLLRSGTGNAAMRSLKITSADDVRRPELRALIEEAVRDIRSRGSR